MVVKQNHPLMRDDVALCFTAPPRRLRILKGISNIALQLLLVVFDGQNIVRALLHDVSGNRGLTPPGIHGHGAAVEVEQPQHIGNRAKLIRFRIHGALGQHQAGLSHPRAHQMGGVLANAAIMGAAQRFAIHGDDFARTRRPDRAHPVQKALLKLLGIQGGKDAPKLSCDGIPLGNGNQVRNQAYFVFPNSSTPTQLSAPQMTAQIAMATTSSN